MDTRFKQYAIETPTFTDRKMSFVISTAAPDRDNDTINPKGWHLDNYLKNPVVLWAHDYGAMPVAKTTRLVSTDKGLEAEITFPAPGKYAWADTVHDMLKDGFLNATSVGFKAHKAEPNSERKGFDFHEQELLEFSIVPVPSNPEALVTQRQSRADKAVIKQWCAEIKQWADKAGMEMEPDEDECPKADCPMKQAGKALAALLPLQEFADFLKDVETEANGKPIEIERVAKLLELNGLTKKIDTPKGLTAEDVKALIADAIKPPEPTDFLVLEPSDEKFLDLDTFELETDEIDLTPADLAEIVKASTRTALAETVGAGIQQAINRLRGCVD